MRRTEARRALLETFVSVFDDDPDLTLETDLEAAILHLPDDQQQEARILLETSDVDGRQFRLKDLFTKDPDSY
jgi:hypothetical protein